MAQTGHRRAARGKHHRITRALPAAPLSVKPPSSHLHYPLPDVRAWRNGQPVPACTTKTPFKQRLLVSTHLHLVFVRETTLAAAHEGRPAGLHLDALHDGAHAATAEAHKGAVGQLGVEDQPAAVRTRVTCPVQR